MTRPHVPRYPALEAFHAELRSGERTPYTFDALWRAACCERNAIEALSISRELHDGFMQDAQRIVSEALRQEREGRK